MEQFEFDSAFTKMMRENQLDTVVILAHINPDGDAAGSVMGLAHYIRCTYPDIRVLPYLSEKLDKGPKRQVLQDPVFQPFISPEVDGKAYGVIVCDTATLARIAGKEYYDGAAVSIVLDHHASNEGYGDVNYTKISESCAENVFYMVDHASLSKAAAMEDGQNVAYYMYLGMIHDTDGFDRATVSTLEAAAALQKLGISHGAIMKTLKTDTYMDLFKRMELLSEAVRSEDGKVAYVFVDQEERKAKNIGYEDIHPISGLLRDCEDIELGFTFYEEEPGLWRCSFRSDGKWINVNELMKPFGGGGHAGAAGLRKRSEDPKGLIREILDRVDLLRKDK